MAVMIKLISYGGWITVSSIVSPILNSIDRLIIAKMLGASSVTHYSIPYNIASKIQLFPRALSRSLFPRISSAVDKEALELSTQGVLALMAVITPIVVLLLLFIKVFFTYWIGPELSSIAAPVGEILLLGIWINSLAYLPLALIQAQGAPRTVALIHIGEFIPFIILLWFSLSVGGLKGAAVAWTLRVTVDALLLGYASNINRKAFLKAIPSIMILICVFIIVSTFTLSVFERTIASIPILFISFIISYKIAPESLLQLVVPGHKHRTNRYAEGDT